jgi:hypothetical protein
MLVGIGAPALNVWTPAGFCHQETPFLTQYKAVAAYTLPYGVRISGTFASVPGPVVAANQIYSGVLPSLGRPFFLGQSQVNVVEPGTLYGDRINQLDFRFAKNFQFGGKRAMVSLDLYNVINANPVLTYNNSFTPNGPWLQPNSILTGRLARISAEWTF